MFNFVVYRLLPDPLFDYSVLSLGKMERMRVRIRKSSVGLISN